MYLKLFVFFSIIFVIFISTREVTDAQACDINNPSLHCCANGTFCNEPGGTIGSEVAWFCSPTNGPIPLGPQKYSCTYNESTKQCSTPKNVWWASERFVKENCIKCRLYTNEPPLWKNYFHMYTVYPGTSHCQTPVSYISDPHSPAGCCGEAGDPVASCQEDNFPPQIVNPSGTISSTYDSSNRSGTFSVPERTAADMFVYYCNVGSDNVEQAGECVQLSKDPNSPTIVPTPTSDDYIYTKVGRFECLVEGRQDDTGSELGHCENGTISNPCIAQGEEFVYYNPDNGNCVAEGGAVSYNDIPEYSKCCRVQFVSLSGEGYLTENKYHASSQLNSPYWYVNNQHPAFQQLPDGNGNNTIRACSQCVYYGTHGYAEECKADNEAGPKPYCLCTDSTWCLNSSGTHVVVGARCDPTLTCDAGVSNTDPSSPHFDHHLDGMADPTTMPTYTAESLYSFIQIKNLQHPEDESYSLLFKKDTGGSYIVDENWNTDRYVFTSGKQLNTWPLYMTGSFEIDAAFASVNNCYNEYGLGQLSLDNPDCTQAYCSDGVASTSDTDANRYIRGFLNVTPSLSCNNLNISGPTTKSHLDGNNHFPISVDVQNATGEDVTVNWSWGDSNGDGVIDYNDVCGEIVGAQTLVTGGNGTASNQVDFNTWNRCTGIIVATASSEVGMVDCDSVSATFTITNVAPTVVSVTPASGLSGTLDDADNSGVCSDNNPVTYTATFSDPDGCADLQFASLWIDDNAQNYAQASSSAHPGALKGAQIIIYASGTQAYGKYPDMQLLINDKVVKVYNNISTKSPYFFNWPSVLQPGMIKIRIPNYLANRNLTVDKIVVNGVTYQTESGGTQKCAPNCIPSTDEYLTYPNAYFAFMNSQNHGTTGFSGYGLKYDSTLNLSCSGQTGVNCWKNYSWGTPDRDGTSGYLSSALAGQYTDQNGDNTSSLANWKVNSASCSSGNLVVTYEVKYRGNIGTNLNIYAVALDSLMEGSGWVDKGDWTLDLTYPTKTGSLTPVTSNIYSAVWQVSDSSGIYEAGGRLSLLGSTYPLNSKIATNLTPNPIVAVTLPISSGGYSPTSSWSVTYTPTLPGSSGRTETISIGDISEGTMRFGLYATDGACNRNFSEIPGASDVIGNPWMISKGGYVYSKGAVSVNVASMANSSEMMPHYPEYVWDYPYEILKNQAQISTELITSGASIHDINTGIDVAYRPPTSSNYVYAPQFTYASLLESSLNYGSDVQVVPKTGNLTGGSISEGCNDATKKFCIINVTGNTIISGPGSFMCDKGTLIKATSITIDTTITNIESDASTGCIFMSSSNITIQDGSYASSGSSYPKYDIINGYLIAKNRVLISRISESPIIDGLKINGGIVAFGGNATDSSIFWQRNLQLIDNQQYPSLVVSSDPRYSYISTHFFSDNMTSFVHESGYKPY